MRYAQQQAACVGPWCMSNVQMQVPEGERLHGAFLDVGFPSSCIERIEVRANHYILASLRTARDAETGRLITAAEMLSIIQRRRHGAGAPAFIDFRDTPIQPGTFVNVIVHMDGGTPHGAGLSVLWLIG